MLTQSRMTPSALSPWHSQTSPSSVVPSARNSSTELASEGGPRQGPQTDSIEGRHISSRASEALGVREYMTSGAIASPTVGWGWVILASPVQESGCETSGEIFPLAGPPNPVQVSGCETSGEISPLADPSRQLMAHCLVPERINREHLQQLSGYSNVGEPTRADLRSGCVPDQFIIPYHEVD